MFEEMDSVRLTFFMSESDFGSWENMLGISYPIRSRQLYEVIWHPWQVFVLKVVIPFEYRIGVSFWEQSTHE